MTFTFANIEYNLKLQEILLPLASKFYKKSKIDIFTIINYLETLTASEVFFEFSIISCHKIKFQSFAFIQSTSIIFLPTFNEIEVKRLKLIRQFKECNKNFIYQFNSITFAMLPHTELFTSKREKNLLRFFF